MNDYATIGTIWIAYWYWWIVQRADGADRRFGRGDCRSIGYANQPANDCDSYSVASTVVLADPRIVNLWIWIVIRNEAWAAVRNGRRTSIHGNPPSMRCDSGMGQTVKRHPVTVETVQHCDEQIVPAIAVIGFHILIAGFVFGHVLYPAMSVSVAIDVSSFAEENFVDAIRSLYVSRHFSYPSAFAQEILSPSIPIRFLRPVFQPVIEPPAERETVPNRAVQTN